MEQFRPGAWKIFSNTFLRNVRPLSPHRIEVDALGLTRHAQQLNHLALKEALAALTPAQRLYRKDDLELLFIRRHEAPGLLELLGRAREVTFRAAGQGVGRDVDLSPEDDYYHQLIVWDHSRKGIAGAYRTGILRAILDKHDPLVRHLESQKRGIPPLMRYYCQLGARFINYHVEPSFQDALYCLLRVDLPSVPDTYKRRFAPKTDGC